MPRIEIPDISFVHITPKDWLHFKELDPLDRLELMTLPGAFAIGAMDESEEEAVGVGLMVVLQEKDRYVLEWLCVDEDHRRLEIGGALLTMLFDMALEKGHEKVAVRITSELKSDVDRYFFEHFFEDEEKAPDMFRVKVTDFLQNGKLIKPATHGVCNQVGSLGHSGKNQIWDYISGCGEKFSLYEGQMNWEYVDEELSFASFDKNKKVDGVFICMTRGRNCYPLLLAAEDPAIEQDLISYSIEALQQSEKQGFMLSILCRSRDMSEQAGQIANGMGRIHQKLLVAETSRYKDLISSMDF